MSQQDECVVIYWWVSPPPPRATSGLRGRHKPGGAVVVAAEMEGADHMIRGRMATAFQPEIAFRRRRRNPARASKKGRHIVLTQRAYPRGLLLCGVGEKAQYKLQQGPFPTFRRRPYGRRAAVPHGEMLGHGTLVRGQEVSRKGSVY